MNLFDVLQKYNLENSFIIGYYGGTNYGDELLLEILQNIFHKQNIEKVKIYYSNIQKFAIYHHDFKFKIVKNTKINLIKNTLFSKNIVIGGGGLWGLDVNSNIFFMSLLLFISRFVLRKKVFLIGVGYYNSTNILGHVSAMLAGIASNVILARDMETYNNFIKYNKNTSLDKDIIFYIPNISLELYEKDARNIIKEWRLESERIIVGLRRFQVKHKNNYTNEVVKFISKNPSKKFTIAIFESKHMAPEAFALIQELQLKHSNCTGVDNSVNPLAFYLATQICNKNLTIVAPQYHVQITAHLNGVPFMPISYDRKNAEFFKIYGLQNIYNIETLLYKDISDFLEEAGV